MRIDRARLRRLVAATGGLALLAWAVLGAGMACAQDNRQAGELRGAPRLENLLGRWRSPDDASEIVIERAAPDDPRLVNSLVVHTRKHSWHGVFDGRREPQPARIEVTMQPQAAEMNAEIPAWARQQVEGRLEWRLRLDEIDDCLCSGLRARWFPGEVGWEEQDGVRTATVTGPGKPIELNYRRVPPDPLHDVKEPVLFLRSADRNIAHYEPLQSVAKQTPFIVEVVLPADLAATQGDSLTVELRGRKSGAAARIDLARSTRLATGAWSYMTDPPVELRNFSLVGPAVNLRVGNGEAVVATYSAPNGESASEIFTLYETWAQQGLDHNLETLNLLGAVTSAMLAQGTTLTDGRPLSAGDRAILARKLQMIANARQLLAQNAAELIALSVGQSYLGMLQDREIENWTERRRTGGGFEYHGLHLDPNRFTSDHELETVTKSIDEAYDRYANVVLGFVRDLGIDTFHAVIVGHLDNFLIAFYGTDVYGRPYDAADRVMAGIHLVRDWAVEGTQSGLGEMAAGARLRLSEADSERRSWRAERARQSQDVERQRFRQSEASELMRGRDGARKFYRQAPGEVAFHEDLGGLPDSARFLPGTQNSLPDTDFQCRGDTCSLQSLARAASFIGKKVASVINEKVLAKLAGGFGVYEPGQGTYRSMMPKLARLLGLPHDVQVASAVGDLAALLDQGGTLVVSMLYLDEAKQPARGTGHSIHVYEIIRSSVSGEPSYVKYWDPWTGRSIGMTACDFQSIFAAGTVLRLY